MLNQRVKVSSGTYLAPPIVNVVQNDTGRVLVCEPFDYTITGAETATLICRRPDDTIFTYTGTVNADDNDVSIPMATEGGALTQVGDVDAELILTASGATITSFKITIRVQEDISGEATPEEKTFVAQLVAEVDASFAEYQAALNDVEGQLDDLVPKTTKVNGKALSSDITLAPSDLGAVPETRTVNGHALDENVELDASDVGAVPEERTVNNYPLDDDVNVMAVDVPFTPNGSLTSDNVQDAIDEVRDMVEVGREVELYDGSTTAVVADTYTLEDDVANYQYLDFWIGYNGRASVHRVPVRENVSFSFRIPNISDGTSTLLYVSELSFSFSGTVLTVSNVGAWQQGNGSTYNPTRSSAGAIYIEKIYGIKYDAIGGPGGGVPIVIDDQLSPNSTNPVQNKVLYNALQNATGFTPEDADLLQDVLYMNEYSTPELAAEAKDKIDTLIFSLKRIALVSISAVYSGGSVYEGTSVDDLDGLVVTATYSDESTKIVEYYTMSPETIDIGTNIITVTYYDKTTTFTVSGIEKPVASISAVYSGGSVVEGTDVETLRSDITVTATYEDSTTATVTNYTISGAIAVGSNTIAISYGGKSTTITVTGTAAPKPNLLLTAAVRTEEGSTYGYLGDQIRITTSSGYGTLYIVPVTAGKTYKYSMHIAGQYNNPYINNYQIKSLTGLSPSGSPASGANPKTYVMGTFTDDPDYITSSYSRHFTVYEVNSTSSTSTIAETGGWRISIQITYTHDGYAIFARSSASDPILEEVT